MRKGQVALFVLLGLVLVLLLLLLLFLRPKPELEVAGESRVPVVSDAVERCVALNLESLLRQAGANGGLLDPSRLRRSPQSWRAEAVEFPPQVVPYWSHVEECASSEVGCESSEQPPLCAPTRPCPVTVSLPQRRPSLQEQLEARLPEAVGACIDRLDLEEFTVEPRGKASAEVTFTPGGIFAALEQPLLVTSLVTGESVTLTTFTGRADVDIVRLYGLAHAIAQAERDTAFLERLTLHLLAVYSGLGTKLPPMRAVSLLGQKQYWSRTEVERTLQDEVLIWSDFIQVPNALAGFRPVWPGPAAIETLSEEEQAMYAGIMQYLLVKLDTPVHEGLGVRFFYPRTQPYLSINGGQELLKPRSVEMGGFLTKMLGLFMNDYRFRYDLSYPVIVTITDTEAFDGRGYEWSFALEANIRRNEPLNRSAAVTSFLFANTRVDLTAPQQRVRNTLRIAVKDKYFGAPVPYARVSYRCGDEFFIGETDASGRMVTRLPYCRYGGGLLASADGYLGSGIPFDNYEEGVVTDLVLELWPLKEVTLTVRKRTEENVRALDASPPTFDSAREESAPLNASDLVIFSIERLKESPYDADAPLLGFFTFSPSEQRLVEDLDAKRRELAFLLDQGLLSQQDHDDWVAALQESRSLAPTVPSVTASLAPGSYVIDALLILNERITIPAETREFCIVGSGSLCIGRQRFTLNETNLTTWMSGSLTLEEDAPWELNPNTLYRFDTYTFYVLEQEPPRTWSEFEEVTMPDEYARGKRLLMLPTYD